MTTENIEKKLASAISNEVPDVLDSILSRCETQEQNVIELDRYKNNPKNVPWLKSLCATAAALAIIVGGYFGIGQYQTAYAVESVVTLDVNPSVKLEMNKTEKIISATGINEDGNSILNELAQDGEKLKGKPLEGAVKLLIDAMVEEGYLSQQSNSILVTVSNPDTEKSKKIESQLMISVDTALSENGIVGAILVQSSSLEKATAELAEKYGISEGKASFIEKIIAKSPQLSFDALASLKINDLTLLAVKWLGEMDELTAIGTPSDGGYVSSDSAIESACTNAKITTGDNAEIGSSIQIEDGKLVYDVSVNTGTVVYKYVIDAETGEIISFVSKFIENENTITDQTDNTSDTTDSSQTSTEDTSNSPISDTEQIIDGIFDFIEGAKD